MHRPLPTYVDSNTLHTTHGRALAFATGVKLADPKLTVITAMGDGDALAIGGNHFIHACRRNIDITAIVANNCIYGMTGGQYSPTTPHGKRGTTAPYGNVEHEFDASALAAGAGASFVARTSAYHVRELDKLLEQAIRHRGFSVVEVMSNCYTSYGRLNNYKSPVDMFRWMKDSSVTMRQAERCRAEELEGKFTRGIFVENYIPSSSRCTTSLAERLTATRRPWPRSCGRPSNGTTTGRPTEGESVSVCRRSGCLRPLGRAAQQRGCSRDEEWGQVRDSPLGSGGQGLMLGGKLLAEAASVYDGKNTVQTQSTVRKLAAARARPMS